MEKRRDYMVPSRFRAIEISREACTGCNMCVDICMMDVLAPNPQKGEPPIVTYPEECWFEGSCVETCPQKEKGAIKVVIPLPMRVSVLWGKRP